MLLAALSASAQSLTNFAGVLNGINFEMPTELTGTVNNGVVTFVPQSSDFSASTFQVTVQNNGSFSGSNSGTIAIDGQGAATVYPSGDSPVSLRVNYSQDTYIGTSLDNSSGDAKNSLDLLAHAPGSVSMSDLAGAWSLVTFDAPQQLIQVLATNGALVDLLGMKSNSVFSSSLTKIGSGIMNINSDGTLSGVANNPFSGTLSIGSNGQLTFNITGGDTFTMPGIVNSSKDVIIALQQDNANNRNEIALMVKNPPAVLPSDLKGLWQVTTYNAPSQVGSTTDTNGYVTSISTIGSFNMSQSSWFVAGGDGFISGSIDGVSATGTFSSTESGTATITFTNSLGETQTHTGHLNAGKNCIVITENDGDSLSMAIVTKAPDWPGSTQNVGLQPFGSAGLVWAADTNTVLQSSDSLGGGWNDISSTLGQHQFSPDPTNSAQFYRVKIQ